MNNKKFHLHRSLVSVLLALALCMSLVPAAFAAQDPTYHDPAEHWQTANNRTNELDANAIVTHETFYCAVCEKKTSFLAWRVPEYTRDGQSALTRNILYSDGTMVDGEGTGRILDGTPGKDAYYTGYHWTKSMCENCGTIGSNGSLTGYGFNNNVYNLYDCAAEFMEALPETVAYEYVDDTQHRVTTTSGEFCVFCFGTRKNVSSKLERHDLETAVLPQPANGRFATVEHCEDCAYTAYDYTAAKAVIADYYGVADGQAHTITVSDLSESGVTVSIRYGNSAGNCNLATAPSYTEAGQYAVYYAITYAYKGQTMTENGVANVWLRDESVKADGTCGCGCGDPDCGCEDKDCGGKCQQSTSCGENHKFILLDSVDPGCLTLGYNRYLCTECGKIEKRDYEAALGHAYQSFPIREATCETDGKLLKVCSRCGDTETTSTPKGEHKYKTYDVDATCTSPGYTVKECSVCGDRHITNITSALPHTYEAHVTPATCENGGKTVHLCDSCGSSFVTDYTDALGHQWDAGKTLARTTCTTDGVTEYHCTRCGETRMESDPAVGHVPGPEATCTEPQVCEKCGEVLHPATGHRESDWIVDREPTTDAEGERHKECEDCGEKLESESVPRLNDRDITDSHGEAEVGGYLIIVTDTDTEGSVMGAVVSLNKDNSLAIRLPDGRLLDYADQTTVTVLIKKDKSAVPGVNITVTDKNDNHSADTTDKAGQITVPGTSGKTNDSGKTTVGGEDEDGNRSTLTVKVEDYESGRSIKDADVSISKSGKIGVVLPDGVDMDAQNRIKVTVTDHEKAPQEGLDVTVRNDMGRSDSGKTDGNGVIVVPEPEVEAVAHSAYIVGYPDGTFGPSNKLTRSEAAAIFARLLAAKNGDVLYDNVHCSFTDVSGKAWYAGYVKYLETFDIVKGYLDGTYRPGEPITRSEFVAMAVRFCSAYSVEDGDRPESNAAVSFSDVSSSNWAAGYIREAAAKGWVIGYGDGTFGGDNDITRAEVVTLVNRILNREADQEYVKANLGSLNTFPDMSASHWAYWAVMEAANNHTAPATGTEKWLGK